MKKKILVVEDFGTVRAYICDMLRHNGYDTIDAADVALAEEKITAEAHTIHLVVTDYILQDGTGFDLLKRIKHNASTAHIPVIMLTTESHPDKIQEAKLAGLHAWIRKPYRADHFFDQIRRVLDGQNLM